MRRINIAIMTTALAAALAVPAFANGPVKLTKAQMDQIVGGKITETKTNGGGQTPKGAANGVPTTATNPAGSAPPGQNK